LYLTKYFVLTFVKSDLINQLYSKDVRKLTTSRDIWTH